MTDKVDREDSETQKNFLLELEKQRSKTMLYSSLIPQLGGFICMMGGLIMLYLGVSGTTDFLVESGGFKANLVNASPGIVLIFVGCIIMYLSIPRHSVRMEVGEGKIQSTIFVQAGLFYKDDNRRKSKLLSKEVIEDE